MADGKWQNRPPRSHEKFAQFEHTFTHSSTRSFVQSKNREAMGKVLIRTPPSGRGNFCPMTIGFEDLSGAVVLVPEGYPRIAQRFSVGSTHRNGISPEGTAEPCRGSAVPSGLIRWMWPYPTLKRWAIFSHPSGMRSSKSKWHWVGNPRHDLGALTNATPSTLLRSPAPRLRARASATRCWRSCDKRAVLESARARIRLLRIR